MDWKNLIFGLIPALLAVVIFSFVVFGTQFAIIRRVFGKRSMSSDGIEKELSDLSGEFTVLLGRMKNVESAVRERKAMAEGLSNTIRSALQEIAELEKIRAISKDSAEAVTRAFESKLKSENQRTFLHSSLIGFVYMVAGTILGVVVTHLGR